MLVSRRTALQALGGLALSRLRATRAAAEANECTSFFRIPLPAVTTPVRSSGKAFGTFMRMGVTVHFSGEGTVIRSDAQGFRALLDVRAERVEANRVIRGLAARFLRDRHISVVVSLEQNLEGACDQARFAVTTKLGATPVPGEIDKQLRDSASGLRLQHANTFESVSCPFRRPAIESRCKPRASWAGSCSTIANSTWI